MPRKTRRPRQAKKKNPLSRDSIPRAVLGRELQGRIREFGLSRAAAAAIVNDAASQMSRLMTGHIEEFSADRLVGFLLKLGTDVEVVLRHSPTMRKKGRATVSVKRARC